MQATISVDRETDARLDRLSSTTGRSKSDLVRDALIALEAAQSDEASECSAFDLIGDLVGVGKDGPADLARTHKQAFRALLQGRKTE